MAIIEEFVQWQLLENLTFTIIEDFRIMASIKIWKRYRFCCMFHLCTAFIGLYRVSKNVLYRVSEKY